MKTKVSFIIALVLILSLSLVSFGEMGIEELKAFMAKDMKFEVNGQMWQPEDVDGSPLYPIIYNGRSYVPLRSLLEDRDVDVDYDADRRTILINDPIDPDDEWEEENKKQEPPKDTPQAPDYEPPLGKKSSPFYVQTSEIGGPYKEWPNYDILFESLETQVGPGMTTTIELDLADDAMFMVNGKETSLKELKEGQVDYYFIINPKDKITLGVDDKTKLVKSLAMDLKPREASKEEMALKTPVGQTSGKLYITIEPQEEVYYGKVDARGKEIKRD